MSRILISEPHVGVRWMTARMVDRLGYTAIVSGAPTPAKLRSVDVMLVESAAPESLRLARTARVANPSLRILCTSVAEPPAELTELGEIFAGTLLKPFTARELDAAIQQALASGADPLGPYEHDGELRAA